MAMKVTATWDSSKGKSLSYKIKVHQLSRNKWFLFSLPVSLTWLIQLNKTLEQFRGRKWVWFMAEKLFPESINFQDM